MALDVYVEVDLSAGVTDIVELDVDLFVLEANSTASELIELEFPASMKDFQRNQYYLNLRAD